MFRTVESAVIPHGFSRYYLPILLLLLTASCAVLPQRAQQDTHDTALQFTPPDPDPVMMRVKLFDQTPADELVLAATKGIVRLTSAGGTRITLSPASPPVTIKTGVGNRIEIHHGQTVSRDEYWLAETSENGLIRIVHPAAGWRNYPGSIFLSSRDSRIESVNTVGLEDYVASVTGSEMNFTNEEALRVQAVISRTYALWNRDRSAGESWDVTDSVMNQVYLGEIMFTDRYRKAAETTTGEVLTWGDELILATYHSTCGGQTVHNESVWTGAALPYLRGIRDHPSCSSSPHFRWDFQLTAQDLKEAIGITGAIGFTRDVHGRVQTVQAETTNGPKQWESNRFRLEFNRHFGSLALRSTYFELEEVENTYIFRGRGLGHGVGLCQWGALGLAESGWGYTDILRFYYSGTNIVNISRLARFSSEFPGL